MARLTDKPKKFKKQENVENIKIETKDTYGFEKTIDNLNKNGYNAIKENGVLMIYANKKEYEKIEKIIKDSKFKGSWGVKFI